MAKLSTSAWILHDLGMAAGFGGNLFGQTALDPAVRKLDSAEQRVRVRDDAWGRFQVVDAVSLGAMAATWLIGRSTFSGRRLGRPMRRLVIAKDVFVGAALLTGVASLVAGALMRKKHHQGALTTKDEAAMRRFLQVMGPINAACIAGTIGVNAALAQESGKSFGWSTIARALP